METYRDFVDQILRPTNFEKLKFYEKITVRVFHNLDDEPEELEFDQLYPFHTIGDLQTIIYIAMDQEEAYHPYNQCILLPVDESKTPYLHFQYTFNDILTTLANPFTLINSKPDLRFVDLNGAPKNPKTISRESVTLQTALFYKEKETYTIDLFLYSDILSQFSGERPISRVDWEGKFRVYFPMRNKDDENGQIPEKILEEAPVRIMRFEKKLELIEKTDEFLQENSLRIPGEKGRGDPIGLASFRNLRIAWKKPRSSPGYEPIRLDSLFYDIPVSKNVPYIRFYPKASVPLSKVFVNGPLNIPVMEHPEILLQWSQEASLTPQEDMIMLKFLIRSGSGSINPLYGTLFIFQDGSAKMIIQPNAESKSISRVELSELDTLLDSLMSSIPTIKPKLISGSELSPRPMYTPHSAVLEDAYVVLSMWLDREEAPITAKSLMKILPFFRPFFQITSSPIKEQNPLGFLRYKAVDNFRTPARDFQFLSRVLDLQQLSGVSNVPALVKFYKEEFGTDDATAQKRVGAFLKNELEISVTNPEILSFDQSENPGIDLAVFGKQNQYTFHLYRVDSLYNLKMLKTLVSVLVSAEPSFYTGEELEVAATVGEEEDEDAAEEAAASAVEAGQSKAGAEEEKQPTAALLAAAAANESGAGGFDFDELGAHEFGFDEEEVAFKAVEPEAAPKKSVQQLADEDTPEFVPPKKETTKSKKGEDDEGDLTIVDPSQLKQTSAKFYFLSRLKFYDRKLFKYELAPGEKNYGRQCMANAMRQPIVISEDEYHRMKEVYEEDEAKGDIVWVDYPIKKGASLPVSKKASSEKITTLRYGSNLLPGQANIYICSQFWCRNDEIVVLKKDFESTVDRKGKPKEKNTCAFCRGKLVVTKDRIVPGESVLSRTVKDTHTAVGFLKKTNHPSGLRLPCCFVKDTVLYDTNPEFASASLTKRVVKEPSLQTSVRLTEVVEEEEEAIESTAAIPANYAKTLASLPTSYIIGAEKLPLEITQRGPQVGVLSPLLDKFFGQNSLALVKQDHTVWKLMTDNKFSQPNVSGFFRIAGENHKQFQPEAFLSALAPYYGLNSSTDMKRVLKQIITPPLFLGLNYGNFLFDFYNPQKPTPPSLILKAFAQRRLLLASGIGLQQEAVARAWKAYTQFEEDLQNPTVYKEYRQYAPLLAQPTLVSSAAETLVDNGILFIVLEVRGKEISVRCPPYGVSSEMARRCDIAFISNYPDMGIWEPLFYTSNDPEKGIKNKYSLVFRRDEEEGWPPIVKQRVDEFIKSCEGSGMGLYTDSPQINPKTLIPLSSAMNLVGTTVYGILRDTYNHVSAAIYDVNEKLIVVPVIDDGIVYPTTRIELDWRNIMLKLAPANLVRMFYTSKLGPILRKNPLLQATYTIDKLIRLDKTVPDLESLYAFHLAGGLFIPVQKASSPIAALEEINETEYKEGQELPWMIDSKLVYGKIEASLSAEIDHKEFNEIFQHLRLTFANWFSLATPAFKKEIDEILFKDGEPNIDLPLYEKRQRLFIKFGNEVLSWLDSSIPQRNRVQSVKRVDCHIIKSEKECSNRCVWKEEARQCLLHVPGEYEVGENKVDAKELLLKKLIEELIRFPERRDELIKQQVSKYQILRDGFRSGNEYIVPENLPAWTELLRMEWKKVSRELPKHAEEFMFAPKRSEPSKGSESIQKSEEAPKKSGFPEELKPIFGERAKALYFIPEETKSIWPILLERIDLDIDKYQEATGIDIDPGIIIEQKDINELVKAIKFSVIEILFVPGSSEDPTILLGKGVLPNTQKADAIILVQLPDQSVGVLSTDPSTLTPIPLTSLSAGLRLKLHKAPSVEITSD